MTNIKELLRECEPHRALIESTDIEFIDKCHSLDPNQVWEVGKYNSSFAYGRTVKEALDNYYTKYADRV